jgi:hypothetical protein
VDAVKGWREGDALRANRCERAAEPRQPLGKPRRQGGVESNGDVSLPAIDRRGLGRNERLIIRVNAGQLKRLNLCLGSASSEDALTQE